MPSTNLCMSTSLDGCIAAPVAGPDGQPEGPGVERLHEWGVRRVGPEAGDEVSDGVRGLVSGGVKRSDRRRVHGHRGGRAADETPPNRTVVTELERGPFGRP